MIRLRGTDRFTETVPILDEAGHMEPADIERDLEIDIAVRWGEGYETRTQSYVNIIATPKGGTHVAGFERGLTKAFVNVLHNTRLLKNGDEVLKEDVLEGMTAVVTVRLAEPQFEGQTKEVLGTRGVTAGCQGGRAGAHGVFGSTKMATRAQARAVLEKIVGASRARSGWQHREAQRRRMRSSHHHARQTRRLPQQ